jgi:hypothetical protein
MLVMTGSFSAGLDRNQASREVLGRHRSPSPVRAALRGALRAVLLFQGMGVARA